MKLPFPRETLAGCSWLPRIVAKARLLQRGELSPEYVSRFGAPGGVDGQFLGFFALTKEEIETIAPLSDADVATWFLARTPDSREKITAWNDVALNLGRPGYPMSERLAVAKATTYAHIDSANMTTVFEILEADEAQP